MTVTVNKTIAIKNKTIYLSILIGRVYQSNIIFEFFQTILNNMPHVIEDHSDNPYFFYDFYIV